MSEKLSDYVEENIERGLFMMYEVLDAGFYDLILESIKNFIRIVSPNLLTH